MARGIVLVLRRPVLLGRAGDPLPVALGTLDPIHLATALVWRERMDQPLVVSRTMRHYGRRASGAS